MWNKCAVRKWVLSCIPGLAINRDILIISRLRLTIININMTHPARVCKCREAEITGELHLKSIDIDTLF